MNEELWMKASHHECRLPTFGGSSVYPHAYFFCFCGRAYVTTMDYLSDGWMCTPRWWARFRIRCGARFKRAEQ